MLARLRERLLHPPSFWTLNLLAWAAFGVIALSIRYVMHADLGRALWLTLAAETFGFLLSGVLREVYRRMAGDRFLRLPVFAAAAGLTLIVGIVQAGAVQLLVHWTGWHAHFWSGAERWVLLAISMWFVYMSWSLGYFWVKAELAAHADRLRAAEARHVAQRIELELLRSQLDPHFLFNSLNGIATEVPSHPDTAVQMVRDLADYLRYSLDHRHELVTPLAVELDAAEFYLRIERARFGDQLDAVISADQAARDVRVPSFLLQPLIENAVKHGFSSAAPPWKLRVSAERSVTGVRIVVSNSAGNPDPWKPDGVGLESIRKRLAIHYPGRHRFTTTGRNGEVVAELDLEGEPCFA